MKFSLIFMGFFVIELSFRLKICDMKTKEEYIEWFLKESENLYWQTRRKVLSILDTETKDPRDIFFGLNKLYDNKELNESWKEMLGTFWWEHCY